MPRRNAGNGTVGMDAYVPARDLDRFDQLVSIHGAYTALVVAGLRALMPAVAASPALKQALDRDIDYHLFSEERAGVQRTIAIRVPLELQQQFISVFPQWGAISWFVRRLLASFVYVAEDHSFNRDVFLAVERLTAQVAQPKLF
jgi:hypothetical protein